MDPIDVRNAVRTYIEKTFQESTEIADFSDDDSLLDSGVVDSMGVLELVTFLESEFTIEIDDEEVVPENFESVASIVSFVSGKRSG